MYDDDILAVDAHSRSLLSAQLKAECNLFWPGDKYLADLAAFRGMDLKESQELINHYQDHSGPFGYKCCCSSLHICVQMCTNYIHPSTRIKEY